MYTVCFTKQKVLISNMSLFVCHTVVCDLEGWPRKDGKIPGKMEKKTFLSIAIRDHGLESRRDFIDLQPKMPFLGHSCFMCQSLIIQTLL